MNVGQGERANSNLWSIAGMISFPLSRAPRISAQHPGIAAAWTDDRLYRVSQVSRKRPSSSRALLECATRVSKLRSRFEYRSVIKQDNEKDLPVADTNEERLVRIVSIRGCT